MSERLRISIQHCKFGFSGRSDIPFLVNIAGSAIAFNSGY